VIGALSARYPGVVAISATQELGFDDLLKAIDAASRGEMVGVEILVPYGSERVLATLRKIGGIDRTEYVDSGTRAWGWAPRHAAGRFEPYSVASGTNGSRRGRRRPG
jgi:50S ribosomal subunit-associated GTPase HflX